jgi:hypothetical protein
LRLHGRFDGFRAERPLILGICGAFSDPETLSRLPELIPDCDVIVAHLPGMHSPHLDGISVEDFAAAFDEALRTRFPDRTVLRFGVSLGGVVTLAMREGQAFVAVDPPLSMSALWPAHSRLRQALKTTADPRLADWVANLFGLQSDGLTEVDYRPLLESCEAPGIVLIAGQPLEPERPLAEPPGALSREDRELIAAHPRIRSSVVLGVGHDLLNHAPLAVLGAIRQGLEFLPAA